jgi:hypothetical protein
MKKNFLLIFSLLVVLSFAVANMAKAACNPTSIPSPAPSNYAGCTAGNCGSGGYCGCDVTRTKGYSCIPANTTNIATDYTCKSNLCPGASGAPDEKKCCIKKSSSSPSASGSPAGSGSPSKGSPSGGSSGGGGTTVNLADLAPVKIEATPEGLAGLIGDVINATLGVVGALALFMFIYGGVYLLSSAGSAEKVKKGKDVITWSIIGIAVILGSYALANFVITGLQGQGGTGGTGGTGSPTTEDCGSAGCCGQTLKTKSKTPPYSCISVKNSNLSDFNCESNLCPGASGAPDEKKCCQLKTGSASPASRNQAACTVNPGYSCTTFTTCANKTGAELSSCLTTAEASYTCKSSLCHSSAGWKGWEVCCKPNK